MATRTVPMGARMRLLAAALLALAVTVAALGVDGRAAPAPSVRLSDQAFWKLINDLSEENGSFQSDNLMSNEARLQYIIPQLQNTVEPGGTYIGVGPEQNFTLMAIVRPSFAFILDIRRANLDLQLLYKALFELSSDRVEFVSRLFSRPRPAGLTSRDTAAELFSAIVQVDPSESFYKANLKAIDALLTGKHGFRLTADDLKSIEYAYHAFFTYGPSIKYSSSDGFAGEGEPTYIDLMLGTDSMGHQHGFLTSEEAFAFVKDLETRNAVVPVVGNFAGPTALRGIGAFVREHGSTVTAFYVSNVEQYLRLFRTWQAFCANARTLPANGTSTIIRAGRGGRIGRGTTMTFELAPMLSEVEYCGPNRFQ